MRSLGRSHRTLVLALLSSLSLSLFVPLAATAGEKEEALWNAAREGDVAAVKKLLAEGVDVDAKNRYEATALFFACDKGHTEVVRTLIEHGADVNAKDNFYGATPLSWAVMNERLGALRLLLEQGVEGAGAALPGAVGSGNLEMLKLLVEKGKPTAEELSLALDQAERQQASGEEGAETAAQAVALLKAAGAEPPPAADFEVPAATLARYAGSYQNEEGVVLALALVEGRLQASFAGNDPLPLGALDAITFQPDGIPAIKLVIQVADGEAATPTGVIFHRGPTEMPFTRVTDDSPEGDQ